MKMLLTKRFAFEMAHALPRYDGRCRHLHGHSYHLEVTVECAADALDDDGMALDFHRLKQLVQQTVVDRFDHALVLPKGVHLLADDADCPNLIEVPFQPTTERLLLHFASLLQPEMPAGARLHSIKLAETDTSVAELVL